MATPVARTRRSLRRLRRIQPRRVKTIALLTAFVCLPSLVAIAAAPAATVPTQNSTTAPPAASPILDAVPQAAAPTCPNLLPIAVDEHLLAGVRVGDHFADLT